jgi:hypothetical protein
VADVGRFVQNFVIWSNYASVPEAVKPETLNA